MSYFYGPVASRRLGLSLGIDILPKKICTFSCVYCQLGSTPKKTLRRFSFVDLDKFKKELKSIIKKNPQIKSLTIAGSGEPTLHKDLDKIISIIKKVTKNKYSVCVITNSSLLYRKEVRKELMQADIIIPSLDSGILKSFQKVNRPHPTISLERIIEGLVSLRKEFKGKIWLEVMLVKGFNDSIDEAKKIHDIVKMIKPDKVQLNLPIRPAANKVFPPCAKNLKFYMKTIDLESEIVDSQALKVNPQKAGGDIEVKILNFLKVRPAKIDDFSFSFGLSRSETIKYLNVLRKNSKVIKKGQYFIYND